MSASVVKWTPAAGWLFVQKFETEESVGKGTIVIPVQARDRLTRWQYEVVASGGPPLRVLDAKPTKRVRTYHDFQPGDWVITPPRQVSDIDEERLLLLPIESVWGLVSEAGNSRPESR